MARQKARGMTCSIPACTSPVRSRGWCSAHYQAWQRHGHPTSTARQPIIPETPTTFCTYDNCTAFAAPGCNGECPVHYRRTVRAQADAAKAERNRAAAAATTPAPPAAPPRPTVPEPAPTEPASPASLTLANPRPIPAGTDRLKLVWNVHGTGPAGITKEDLPVLAPALSKGLLDYLNERDLDRTGRTAWGFSQNPPCIQATVGVRRRPRGGLLDTARQAWKASGQPQRAR